MSDHDWRTTREQLQPEGLLRVERCRRCQAGRTSSTDHETRAQVVIATYPDPLPETCPQVGPHFYTE